MSVLLTGLKINALVAHSDLILSEIVWASLFKIIGYRDFILKLLAYMLAHHSLLSNSPFTRGISPEIIDLLDDFGIIRLQSFVILVRLWVFYVFFSRSWSQGALSVFFCGGTFLLGFLGDFYFHSSLSFFTSLFLPRSALAFDNQTAITRQTVWCSWLSLLTVYCIHHTISRCVAFRHRMRS